MSFKVKNPFACGFTFKRDDGTDLEVPAAEPGKEPLSFDALSAGEVKRLREGGLVVEEPPRAPKEPAGDLPGAPAVTPSGDETDPEDDEDGDDEPAGDLPGAPA